MTEKKTGAHAKKGVPARKRTCRDFLEYWSPKLREINEDAELDYSFRDDAITVTDMTIPSALRTGVLFTRAEVEDREDQKFGEFAERIKAYMLAGRPK